MIQYRKILELHFTDVSQRNISTSVGSSRNTVSDVIKRAEKLGLEWLTYIMNNHWLEECLFPEKQAIEKGVFPPDWENIHRELQKENVTLKLLHMEYDQQHVMVVKSLMLTGPLQKIMVTMPRNTKQQYLFERSQVKF